ncbi:MAG: exo-alpha-sialidase, partial [Spirosomaceae bacterium]|nr:exo-alpha-sialidase [Spirosomataceae bacterium]
MLRTKILFFVLLVVGMCFRAKAQNTPIKQDLFLPQALHVHGSTLVQLPNGDWLVAWFEGSGERTAPDVAIMGARRRRGQSQWSKPFVMADVPLFPDINPVLFVDARKQLWLVWYTVLADQWETSVLKYRTSTNYLKADAPVWAWQEDIHVKLGESTPNGILPNHSFLKAVTAKLNRQGQL